LRDIPATVTDLLGLAAGSPFPGRSLAGCWDAAKGPAGPVLSNVIHSSAGPPGKLLSALGPTWSLVADGQEYIQNPFGREELYDLARDSAQAQNLAARVDARPGLLRFRAALARLSGERGGKHPAGAPAGE